MNEREKKAIEILKEIAIKTELDFVRVAIETVITLIEKQQAEIEDCKKCILRDEVHNYIEEIEKQDKIIDLMAEQLTTPVHSKEWVIDFYKKEIEKV